MATYGRTPFEIALDPGKRFLYRLNVGAGTQSLHARKAIEPSQNVGLAEIGAIGLLAGSSPIGLVVTNRPK